MPGVGELIRSGRTFVAERWGIIIIATVGAPLLVSVVSEGLERMLRGSFLVFLVNIAVFALSLVMSLGAKRITLDIARGKLPRLSDLFSQTNLFWKFLLASIIYGVAVIIGFILLIVPGLYLSLKYGLYAYIIVDRPELSATDALKESARLTDGIKWKLVGFSFVLLGINLLGLLALGIGLLYTIPVSIMAYTALYCSLAKTEAVTTEVPAAEEAAVSAPTETPAA